MTTIQTRRRFLTTLSLAGAASLVRARHVLAAEGALETTTVRFIKSTGVCRAAPERLARELLLAEGFTDIHYMPEPALDTTEAVGSGAFDFSMNFASTLTAAIDHGVSITALAGVHVGCFGLFAHGGIRGIADLRGKSVAVPELRGPAHLFVAAMAAHVGIDPGKGIHWVPAQGAKAMELFAAGKADAFLGTPPQPQELRARQIGHLVVDSAVDRPWSQYSAACCMATGNLSRTILSRPSVYFAQSSRRPTSARPSRNGRRASWSTTAAPNPTTALSKIIRGLPYDKWREYDPEDSLRFYALRLHEADLIKASRQKIIAEGTDWRFLNELKHELKA
jgi:NitT/TauT family transport system substrate-binding protein